MLSGILAGFVYAAFFIVFLLMAACVLIVTGTMFTCILVLLVELFQWFVSMYHGLRSPNYEEKEK